MNYGDMEITAAYTKNVNLDLNSDPDTNSDLDSDARRFLCNSRASCYNLYVPQ